MQPSEVSDVEVVLLVGQSRIALLHARTGMELDILLLKRFFGAHGFK